ncbi:class I SAM-dependent methyltransferase [Streptosporangium saharense]|uniref:class I SAM-dependent methyltransferase n=1 Tax=Streptosporangium saharense TaxID=1706840 RepID=UPI0034204C39
MTQQSGMSEITRRSNDYYREGSLDSERWAKIAELPDYEKVISDFNWAEAIGLYCEKDSVSILDCGCGVGHFPRQLQGKVTFPEDVTYYYDTLDPSSYSLTEHRNGLRYPFNPRNSFNSAVEDFLPMAWLGGYEIIWCMHSLYTVPRERLPRVVSTLASLLSPDGRCFIYLPKKHSAYMTLFDLYLEEAGHERIQPYLTAEEVLSELAKREALAVETVDCSFDHWIEASEPQTLSTYLNQISLRPVRLTYDEWQRNTTFAPYLDKAFDHGRSAWRFQQEVSLISFSWQGGTEGER